MDSSSLFSICRLCLITNQRLINIFEINGRHGYAAADIITDLLQFKVCMSDGYPPFVCCDCLDKLTDFKIFKEQCVNSRVTYENKFCLKDDQYQQSIVRSISGGREDDNDTSDLDYIPVHITQESDEEEEELSGDKGAEDLSFARVTDDDEPKESKSQTPCEVMEEMMENSDNEVTSEHDTSDSQNLSTRKDYEAEKIEVCPEVSHLTSHLSDENECKSEMAVMDLRKPKISEDAESSSHQEYEKSKIFSNSSESVNISENSLGGHHLGHSLNSFIAENLSNKKNCNLASSHCANREDSNKQTSTQEEFYKRERPYKCEECGWRFVNTNQLEKHMQIHSADKPFECEECGWRFFNRGQLTRHQKSHNGEKPFACQICGKKFVRKSSLVTHHRIHTGEKPFSCTECGSSFAQSGDLAKHMRIHSGEKPFPCHECGKTFAQSSDLAKHFRVHSGEKPYACDECYRRFASTCDLNRHKMGHRGDKPFECELCEKRFIRRSALVIHIRTHTGEKPYSCPECGKGFPQRSGLATHLRVHSGERPYPCSECDKRFNTSGDLKRHMNVHTK